MFRKIALFTLALFPLTLKAEENTVFELRTYHANDGKLPALQSRFRDHTLSLFEKHGMTNVGYWVPTDNEQNLLIYLLSYPNKEARDKSWKDFRADEDWKAAYQASTSDGKLVGKIDSVLLNETDFSNGFNKHKGPARLFEMRTYIAADGMLPHLHKRFRDHTISIFKKHGMTNLGYFELLDDQKMADSKLIYFLAHQDEEAARKSWAAFRADPEWKAVASESEKTAGGRILKKFKSSTKATDVDSNGDGVISDAEHKAYEKTAKAVKPKKAVQSAYLQPVDFSPVQ